MDGKHPPALWHISMPFKVGASIPLVTIFDARVKWTRDANDWFRETHAIQVFAATDRLRCDPG